MTQQTFRCDRNQRLAQRPFYLSTEHVKSLCRSGRNAYLNVVLGAQLQEALNARRTVFWSLPFIAMRQQQGQTTKPPPLMLATGQKLIYHDLGAIGKVAELGFPDNQCIRRGGRIAVLECHHRLFRQEGVVDLK